MTAVGRAIAMLVTIATAIAAVLSGSNGWRGFAVSWAISAIYTLAIALPARIALARVGPWARRRALGTLRSWLVYLAVLVVLSAVGTALAGAVVAAIGWVPFARFREAYIAGFKIGLVIAVTCTAGALSMSRLRRQAESAELGQQRALALASEARLASLESRVQPHFLFNALNSAIALVPTDPARAEQVLERLATLLRFSLDAAHNRLVPLGDELRVVTDYLEIERVRFGDRLRYTLAVPDELQARTVPAFALQTLAENSVKYAVSPRTAGAAIAIAARVTDGSALVLEVSDDGPGFAGAPWVVGHGLDNLRARLASLYGSAAELAVSAPGAGARVTVTVPA